MELSVQMLLRRKQMTNGEMFKTASERTIAYSRYCDDCAKDGEDVLNGFDWLDAEYIVKLKSCPFCGSEASVVSRTEFHHVTCRNAGCTIALATRSFSSPEEAIAAWNKRAK
jgi:Lar family restriction alleviation protein